MGPDVKAALNQATIARVRIRKSAKKGKRRRRERPWRVRCSLSGIAQRRRRERIAKESATRRWHWYRAMRVGQAAVPGPKGGSQDMDRALEQAAAGLERWARRRGWRAPESEQANEAPAPEVAQHPPSADEPPREDFHSAISSSDEREKQELLASIERLGVGERIANTPSPVRTRGRRKKGAPTQEEAPRHGDARAAMVETGTAQPSTIRESHSQGGRSQPGKQVSSQKGRKKSQSSAAQVPGEAKCKAKDSVIVAVSQSQRITPAQSSNERWRGAPAEAGNTGTNTSPPAGNQQVAASASQGGRSVSKKSRRKRGVIHGPVDWAKRKATQPRRCKACQCIVAKGSFGVICRTCGVFVCGVPLQKAGGNGRRM